MTNFSDPLHKHTAEGHSPSPIETAYDTSEETPVSYEESTAPQEEEAACATSEGEEATIAEDTELKLVKCNSRNKNIKEVNLDPEWDYDPLEEDIEFWGRFNKRKDLEWAIANGETTSEKPQDIMSDEEYERELESQRYERECEILQEVYDLIELGYNPNEVARSDLWEAYNEIISQRHKGGNLL